jgi:tRNA pseudouridine38-40 synthase
MHDAVPPVRLRLDLAYDGAGFHGWAAQPGLRTVQGDVEAALARILRFAAPPRTTVAGRTDAGVHARAQVLHVDIARPAWHAFAALKAPKASGEAVLRLLRRLNALLSADVRVLSAAIAPRGFDARFSALSRRYCYRIADESCALDPLTRGQVLWHRRPLDLERMALGAEPLVGEHDFAALSRPRVGASTVRRILDATLRRTSTGSIELWIEADAFCHSMVRSIAGALVAVGEARRDPTWMAEVLTKTTRESAATAMPAHGLTLEAVRYPPDTDLAAAAEAHRRLRGPVFRG